LSVAEELVVLVVAAVPAADFRVVRDEFDALDPLDLPANVATSMVSSPGVSCQR
jgi:hypothetical protein